MKMKGASLGVRFAAWSYALIVTLFLLAPILVVIGTSFTESNYISFPPKGFTLIWYSRIWSSGQFASAIWLSLLVAVCTAAISGGLGLMAGLGLYRASFPGRDFIVQFLSLPLVVPAVVLGIGLLQWYSWLGLFPGVARLVFAHVVITLPYVVRLVLSSLAGSDPSLERAAAGLGAGPIRTFFRVTLPRIRSGLIAGVVFAFVVSLDDTGLAIFLVSSSVVTLPVQIFNYISFNFDPVITAVGSLMIFIALIAVVAIERIVGLGRVLAVEEQAFGRVGPT